MEHTVCPWWLGYLIASPVRRLWQNPTTILQPFVKEGMVAFEPGCGMGFFTVDMARLVGPSGKVIAADLQSRMIAGLKRRLRKAGLETRVDARVTTAGSLGIEDLAGKVDFGFVFAVVHELPDQGHFFRELHAGLRQGGILLVAEPGGHVSEEEFALTVNTAERVGFRTNDHPRIKGSRTVVLTRC
jgi:SAM-dependent methyltransferase